MGTLRLSAVALVRAALRAIQYGGARLANRDHQPKGYVANASGADVYKAWMVAKKLAPGGKVLDVGAGNGTFLRQLRLFGDFQTSGVDLVGTPCGLVEAYDGHALRYQDDEFDGTILAYVLHHLSPDHARQIVDEALRVTKPGGILILMEDTVSELGFGYRLRNWAHLAEAGLEYAENSSRYVHPSGSDMFLTHDGWREFLSGAPNVASVTVEPLAQFYKNQHHTLLIVEKAFRDAPKQSD